MQFVLGRYDQVFPVLVVAGILGQGKERSGGEPAGIAAALYGLVVHVQLFDARPCPVVALIALGVAARIVVAFQIRAGVLMGVMHHG